GAFTRPRRISAAELRCADPTTTAEPEPTEQREQPEHRGPALLAVIGAHAPAAATVGIPSKLIDRRTGLAARLLFEQAARAATIAVVEVAVVALLGDLQGPVAASTTGGILRPGRVVADDAQLVDRPAAELEPA